MKTYEEGWADALRTIEKTLQGRTGSIGVDALRRAVRKLGQQAREIDCVVDDRCSSCGRSGGKHNSRCEKALTAV